MRLSRRSYPHPVLGNRDDVPGAAFQATIEVSSDKENIYIDVSIQCSSATILKLVEDARASYVVHVECTNTVFRRAYQFSDMSKKITISTDQLNDVVEVNVFAVAMHHANAYSIDNAHPDYTGVTFGVRRGDILAVGETRTFEVENKDALGRIGTIMQIDFATEDGDQPMRIDLLTGPKIRVILSKPDFERYKELKRNEALWVVFSTSIVLPALVETLNAIKGAESDQMEDLRWYRVLTRRMQALGLKKDGESIIAVQRLLELPIKRTLATAYGIAEASS